MENNLKRLRMQKGLKSCQLAEKIDVPKETMSKYDRGEADIASMKIGMLLKICDVLDCTISDITGISDKTDYRKVHNLKLSIEFCDDVLSGKKNFEIRENDRGFQTGDLIKFTPYGYGGTNNENHEIAKHTYRIKYILNGWGLKNGFVALAIEEVLKDG